MGDNSIMDKRKVILLTLIVFCVFSLISLGQTESISTNDSAEPSSFVEGLDVYYFYGTGCAHCIQVEPFIYEMEQKYSLKLHKFDVYTNMSSLSIFEEYCEAFSLPLEQRGVPAIFVSETYLFGDTAILEDLEEIIVNKLLKNSSTIVDASDHLTGQGVVAASNLSL